MSSRQDIASVDDVSATVPAVVVFLKNYCLTDLIIPSQQSGHLFSALHPDQRGPLSLVEECRDLALIGRERCWRQLSYAMKNQLVASTRGFAPRWFFMA